MTDIPIGSPPVPPGRHAAPSGWYPDPVDQRNERYWDGWQWGRDTRPGSGAAGPAAQPSGQPQAYQPPNPYGQPPNQPPNQPYAQQPYGGYPPATGQPGAGQPGARATTTTDGVPLAGWGWRALAAFIDYVFVSFLTAIPATPFLREMTLRMTEAFQRIVEAAQTGQPAPAIGAADLITPSEQLILAGITFAVGFVYHLLFLRFARATPGKLITGLRVVDAGQGRFTGRLGWRPAVLRALSWMVPQLYSCLLVYLLIDCLFPLWQRNRQALHDLAARTQVIRHRR